MTDRSIELEADPGRGLVRLRVRGRLGRAEAERAVSEVIASHPGFHRLWDFREADLTGWTAEDMRAFADGVGTRERGPGAVRVAALVSREVDFGLARMYEMLSEGSVPVRYAVFRDETQAEAWILGA